MSPFDEGSMAVTLTLRYNDSAAQVDHFNYHAGLGCPSFIVLLVKKQAQTENLARKALTACPELHTLDWSWKSEKYGGGHGNYLISSAIDLPAAVTQSLTARHTFSGQPVTRACWEIQFANAWRGSSLQLWPHKHYGAAILQSAFSNGRDSGRDAVTSPITAAWCLNEQRRGVEIHFTRRPDDATLAPLRADRAWNYTGRTKCWYARQTDATVACRVGHAIGCGCRHPRHLAVQELLHFFRYFRHALMKAHSRVSVKDLQRNSARPRTSPASPFESACRSLANHLRLNT